MTWEAALAGKCCRQPDYNDAAIRTCLTMKVLFGIDLGQIESWERLPIAAPPVQARLATVRVTRAGRVCREPVEADRPRLGAPNFSTLSRRQRRLKVNIPYRGSQGPLHLLIDIEPASATGFERTGEGYHLRFSTRSHPIGKSPASLPTAPSTSASAKTPSPRAGPQPSSHPGKTPSHGSPTLPARSHATRPCVHPNASAGRSGDDEAAAIAEVESSRNQDALCQTVGPAIGRAGL